MRINNDRFQDHNVILPTAAEVDQIRNGKHRRSPAMNNVYSLVAAFRRTPSATVEIERWITIRIYESPRRDANRVYASVWIFAPGFDCSGTGWAGGYGYSKEAAAIDSAFGDAGIHIAPGLDCYGHDAARQGSVLVAEKIASARDLVIEGFEFCS